eukprot:m51a1_g7481 hypothetical protein (89) ;mRNA; f:211069-211335
MCGGPDSTGKADEELEDEGEACQESGAGWVLHVMVPSVVPRVGSVAFEVFVAEVAACLEAETGLGFKLKHRPKPRPYFCTASIRACPP